MLHFFCDKMHDYMRRNIEKISNVCYDDAMWCTEQGKSLANVQKGMED